jgi:hypothetical protein
VSEKECQTRSSEGGSEKGRLIVNIINDNDNDHDSAPPLGLPWLNQTTGKLHPLKVREYMR